VPGLLERSNLRTILDHVREQVRGLGNTSTTLRLHFRIERAYQPDGRAERIVFSAPAFPQFEPDEEPPVPPAERISLRNWLRMAIRRLQEQPPIFRPNHFQYRNHGFTNALLQILRRWESNRLQDDQYTTSVQLAAWYGTTWDGGSGHRRRQRRGYVRVPVRRFIPEATGDHAHHSFLYIQARRARSNPVQHLDRWIQAQGNRVISAAEGYDDACTRLGESTSVPEQPEDRSLNDALASWRNARWRRPTAFLHYVARVTNYRGH
jgi:hypothetical protein